MTDDQIPLTATNIISDRLDRDRRGIRHPPIVRELAQACWYEANGDSGRAWSLLVEECRAGRFPELPSDPDLWPSRRAIERWANAEGWHLQLTNHVASRYQALLEAAAARLILQLPGSLDITGRLADPEYVPAKGDMLKLEAAKHIQTLVGLGTAGARGGAPALGRDQVQATEPANAVEANRLWIKGSKE